MPAQGASRAVVEAMRSPGSILPVLLLAGVAGCASAGGTLHPAAGGVSAACVLGDVAAVREGGSPARLVVAVDGAIEATRAPRPRDAAERVVFAQLYETLVTEDCEGRLVPGLASAWRRDGGDDVWTFTLRPDARFSDGSPVLARDVAESLAATVPAGVIASMAVLRGDELRVQLASAGDAGPARFADAAFAVVRVLPDQAWPLGTGPYTVGGVLEGRRGLMLTPRGHGVAPVLEIRLLGGSDPRNALDEGADLLLTASPVALDYARRHPSWDVALLPWDVAYALIVPERGGPERDASLPQSMRADLARDAVPAAARPAARDALSCPGRPAPAPAAPSTSRIAVPQRDAVAASLAERWVALAAMPGADAHANIARAVPGGAGRMTVAPVDDRSITRGTEAAYIVPLPLRAPDICAAVPLSVAARVLPLVETRPSVVLRQGIGGVRVDGQGALRFESARAAAKTSWAPHRSPERTRQPEGT